jgi:heme d1 biosynthesis radical SAM protein NirJ
MREVIEPTHPVPACKPAGPVVIWNLIRRCNLACKHCYSISADHDFPGELSTREIFIVMDDLKKFGVPALILSGGEPLLHPDIFEISKHAKKTGFYLGLSTNGTLISKHNIDEITAVGYDYVGISIDGIGATHDQFRHKQGAFTAAMNGIELCRQYGLKVGLRFTATRDNAHELSGLLQLMEEKGIDKFYLSHLNYAGRGNRNRKDDVYHETSRSIMDVLIDTCLRHIRRGKHSEFVTGNNDADGVYLLHWVKRNVPQMEAHIYQKLVQWGGNSSGVNVANIDNIGNIHPDTFWWHYPLGNVKHDAFSRVWMDTRDPIMAGLKRIPRRIKGRCATCRYFGICGGNTRVRAFQLYGDPWAEDPGCYLSDEEIGMGETERQTGIAIGV